MKTEAGKKPVAVEAGTWHTARVTTEAFGGRDLKEDLSRDIARRDSKNHEKSQEILANVGGPPFTSLSRCVGGLSPSTGLNWAVLQRLSVH